MSRRKPQSHRPKTIYTSYPFPKPDAVDAEEVLYLDGRPYYPSIRALVAQEKNALGGLPEQGPQQEFIRQHRFSD